MATDKEQTTSSDNTVAPGDLSRLLKEYRESAHLNIDQVSDALCLTPSSIEALESESFDKLPESPYVRGYLRHYARLSDKDPIPLIEVYDALQGEPFRSEDRALTSGSTSTYNEVANPIITPQRFRLALLAALLLLLALLTMIPGVRDWTGNLWSSFSTESSDTISHTENDDTNTSLNLPSLTGDVPGNLPIAPEETETASESPEDNQDEQTSEEDNSTTESANVENDTTEDQSADTTANSETTTPDDESPADNSATETSQPNEDSEDAADNDSATPEGNTKLKLVFTDEVWIRIKDGNGKTVFEALHPAGTEKELSLNSPLKFKVGNAPGMALFVNGKEMDITQFTKGSVAKFGIE
ncbi:MAG: RodZ domain-containing protein [Thiotrichaceae bacterium]